MSFILKTLTYAAVPLLVVRSLSSVSPTVNYYFRLSIYLGSITAVATWGAFVAFSMAIVGKKNDVNFVIARAFYGVVSTLLDIHVELEGAEHLETKPTVVMINHQSMLDILIVGNLMPRKASIMSKKSLKYSPLGPFMMMSGALFVDRGNNVKAVASLRAAANQIKTLGLSLWMFPEGTRHSNEECNLLPFKKGGFHLAIQAGVPITPVVTENYWRIYHQGVFESATLRVKVLPPIPTKGLTEKDVPALIETVRSQMLETLREISFQPLSAESSAPTASASGSSQKPQTKAPAGLAVPEDQDIPIPPWNEKSPTLRQRFPEAAKDAAAAHSRNVSRDSSTTSGWDSVISESNLGNDFRRVYEDEETEEDEDMIVVGKPS